MARIRRNVWAILADPNDDTLEWYGRAVAAMQAREIGDHRSWRYQAAIHDYDRDFDPLASPSDLLPPAGDQDRYWSQCQHNSWFFLPWHRMYLHHFEQIVGAEVASLGGPVDWALPYWNYSGDGASRLLPAPFRDPASPLFVAERDAECNAGDDFADGGDVDLSACLGSSTFASSPFGAPSFGGPATGFNHGGGPIGLLELRPHGMMHVEVGGPTGWMSAFNTAALDPIFWLHHCNIDRLWEVWLRRDPSHVNPDQGFWRSGVRFAFRQLDGADVTMTCAEVIDTLAGPLDYRYDDVADPLGPQLEAVLPAAAMAEERTPEMIGATSAPVVLGERTGRAVVPTADAAPQAMLETPGVTPKRVYLHLEHMTSDKFAPSYDVYVGVPDGEEPTAHPDKCVGRIALFGVVEASRKAGPHAGSGLTVAIDVTEAVERLRQEPGWDPSQLRVSFVPLRHAAGASVRVGRVSLYVG